MLKRYKILFLEIFIALSVGTGASLLYINNNGFLEGINSKITDLFFKIRGEKDTSKDIVIVDIDDKTIKELGGFNREDLSNVINTLNKERVKVILLDRVFPEADESSPSVVCKKAGLASSKDIKDYDKILANSIKNSPVILGFMLSFNSNIKRGATPVLNSILIQKNIKTMEFLPIAKGIISNRLFLQKYAKFNGFFTMIPDEDAIVRSVPLVAVYNDILYPSIVLEAIRYIKNAKKVIINYTSTGIDNIIVKDLKIATDRFGRVVINYKKSSKGYIYISAKDILKHRHKPDFLKNKIILIGSTSLERNSDIQATPIDATFAGVEIIANAIDNILHQNYLYRPSWIEGFELVALFVSLLLVIFSSELKPLGSILTFMLIIAGYITISYYLFTHHKIVLNVAYIVIFSFILYLLLIFIKYLFEIKQRDSLYKKLIKELRNRHKLVEKEVEQRTKELQHALDANIVLIREIHHRVKNNLQLILSIIRLQENEIPQDSKSCEQFRKLENRVRAIAGTHEILCKSDKAEYVNMSAYINKLCEDIKESIAKNDITINTKISAVMPLRQAVYVGLVINELVSNAIKYAFDGNGGKIFIELMQTKNSFTLLLHDNGPVRKKISKHSDTLGLKLVRSLIIYQLNGTIEADNFSYTIKFKI